MQGVVNVTDGLRATFIDFTPSFGDVKGEIENLRLPFKVGWQGHASVIAGWKTESDGRNAAWVLDPLDPNGNAANGGHTRWDYAIAELADNYIYVRNPVFS